MDMSIFIAYYRACNCIIITNNDMIGVSVLLVPIVYAYNLLHDCLFKIIMRSQARIASSLVRVTE